MALRRRPSSRRPGGPDSKAPSTKYAKAVKKKPGQKKDGASDSGAATDAPATRKRPNKPKPLSADRPSAAGYQAFAIAAPGTATLVAAELQQLGVAHYKVDPAGVSFGATEATLFRLNCWSRLAARILVRLDSFEARDFATLEKMAKRVPWSRVLSAGTTAEIVVTCRKSRLYHSDAVAERVAGGIQQVVPGVVISRSAADRDDRDEAEGGEGAAAPSVGSAVSGHRVQRILVRLDRDICTISADSSGELLHRRGYRLDSAKAPLRETLAAALLVSSGWTGDAPLVDPLCGAGTIAVEAALLARRIAPGLHRAFACEFWPGADPEVARAVREAARESMLPASPVPIIAADRDAGAIAATRGNAERAGVLQDITVLHQPLSELDLAAVATRGWMVTNPPYGVRTGDPVTLKALWGTLGAVLRKGGREWTLGVVVPDLSLAREVRVPLERVVATTTGGRPVAFARSRLPDAPNA